MANGTDELVHRLRPADGDPAGVLVLLHGRGADEDDLFPLFDMLDPNRHLLGVSPRAPMALPPGGAHWYVVRSVGFPDPSTFDPTFARLQRFYDSLLSEHGIAPDSVVLGGFSQGAVMSYALGLAKGRPRPRMIAAFSGFMPTVEGLEFDLDGLEGYPVAIGHGTYDHIIEVGWGRDAKQRLEAAGADVHYRESPMPHTIDPDWVAEVAKLIASQFS